MAVIQSFRAMEDLTPAWYAGIRRSSVTLYDQRAYDYSTLYRVQPNVRVCVDFLARNIAQLKIHQYVAETETDRRRLYDFGLTSLIRRPLPPKYKYTYYRFMNSIVGDMGIFFNAYHLKIRDPGSNLPIGLLRIPAQYIYPQGGLVPKSYKISVGNFDRELDPNDVFHIRGYNPENPIFGLSPLETLRRILAEEDSAGKYREETWRNSARMDGIIERPPEAPDWSDEAQRRFLSDFAALYSGEGKGGKTAILEDGMKWVAASFSARESEYLGSRKLTREECARSYFIPPPMIGILDHATFSNIAEQHKNLYQDSLGPWLAMIEQDVDLQLLPEFDPDDNSGIYSEFNILEKLQGNFEDTIKAVQSAVGRPWMTADEGRALFNMRSLNGDAAQLVTPLNVLIGGQASPTDSAPKSYYFISEAKSSKAAFGSYNAALVDRYRLKWVQVLTDFYTRQERSITSRVNPVVAAGKSDLGSGVWWDDERWNAELAADLLALHVATVMEFAGVIFDQSKVYAENPDGLVAFEERLQPLLVEHARIQAENTNQVTLSQVSEALASDTPLESVRKVFNQAVTIRAIAQAVDSVTFGAAFGSQEAAQASSLRSKIWRVNSGNPRESHAALDGYRVGIRETFPNGLRWPGDPRGPADELSGCQCSVEFV